MNPSDYARRPENGVFVGGDPHIYGGQNQFVSSGPVEAAEELPQLPARNVHDTYMALTRELGELHRIKRSGAVTGRQGSRLPELITQLETLIAYMKMWVL